MCKVDFSKIKKASFTGEEIVKILFGDESFRDWQLTERLREICKANSLEYKWHLPKKLFDPATISFKKVKRSGDI